MRLPTTTIAARTHYQDLPTPAMPPDARRALLFEQRFFEAGTLMKLGYFFVFPLLLAIPSAVYAQEKAAILRCVLTDEARVEAQGRTAPISGSSLFKISWKNGNPVWMEWSDVKKAWGADICNTAEEFSGFRIALECDYSPGEYAWRQEVSAIAPSEKSLLWNQYAINRVTGELTVSAMKYHENATQSMATYKGQCTKAAEPEVPEARF